METRAFQIDHNKLLLDVIRRQAGTLSKAILEGVMNAVDAGATRCDISIDETEEQKAFGTFRCRRDSTWERRNGLEPKL
jgi:hypothetical protein